MKNIDVDELKKAVQSGNVDGYMSKNLPPDAQRKIKQVLSGKNRYSNGQHK